MRRSFFGAMLAAAVIIFGTTVCYASLMGTDISRFDQGRPMYSADKTNNGYITPFSTLRDDIPQLWEIYLRPAVTYPTAESRQGRQWFFPEPGLGNPVSRVYGQIAMRGALEEPRTYWLVWDMLGWVPTPHTLFLDPIEMTGSEEVPWEDVRPRRQEIAGFLLPKPDNMGLGRLLEEHEELGIPRLIPAPASLAVFGLLLLLPFKRPRRVNV